MKLKSFIILCAIISCTLITKAQRRTKISEFTASNGVNYIVGDSVRLGLGATDGGMFNYVVEYDETRAGIINANSKLIIKKIIRFKTFRGVKIVFWTNGGFQNRGLRVSIEEAISTCEVIPCLKTQISNNSAIDELAKLKNLLDNGTLTPAEFELAKKKILN